MTSALEDDADFGRRLAAAGAWRAQLAADGVDDSPAFRAWLTAHPDNRRAWASSRASWDVFESAAASSALTGASRGALAWARDDLVRRRRRQRAALSWAATLVLMLGVALGAWIYRPAQTFQTAETRREVVLADGSRVSLDADTLLKVRFRRERRDLELVRGQAAFDVAHDARRPFAVKAGARQVVALGTRFNIDLLGGASTITLLEGRVRVEPVPAQRLGASGASPPATINLRPGQQLVTQTSGGAGATDAAVSEVDASDALAWRAGQLFFVDEPLADVVARVNRYSDTKIEVRDPALAGRRISGMFIAGDVSTFLVTVRNHLAVDAVETRPGRVELRPKAT